MPNRRLVTILLLGCALCAPARARAAPPPTVPALALTVERVAATGGGGVYRIAASGTVAATPAAAWRVLTDYQHLADVVPDLDSARVLARDGNRVIVEQQGAARFLWFSRAIRLVVEVRERPPDRIDVSLVEGDMKVYRGSWELHPADGGGTTVRYDAVIEPAFYVPGIVGTGIVRKDIAAMMTAVLRRMDQDK